MYFTQKCKKKKECTHFLLCTFKDSVHLKGALYNFHYITNDKKYV